MKHTLILLLLFVSNLVLCQDCDDGILNGSETGIDCGGFHCPPCESTTQSKLQQIITQRHLNDIDSVNGNFSIALDATGNRFVVMYWQNILGNNINKVFTGNTLNGQLIEVHTWRNESLAAQYVDMTRDGETILFSDGIGEIFVCNWDGSNLRMVADEIESQNPIFNNFEMTTYSSPKFSYDGSSIYFLHRGNNDVTGLYEVGLNQAIADKWIFSVSDMEDEFGELKSTVHNNAFKDLRIPDSGEVFFLSSIHNEQADDFSIFYYYEGRLRREIQDGPTGIQGYDISTNSHRIFYPSSEGGKVVSYYRPLEEFSEFDFTHFTTGSILDISSNDAGTTALVKAWEWASTNDGDGYFTFNLDGRVLFPIDVGNSTLYTDHDQPELMVMSGQGDRLLFTNSTRFNTRSLWIADFSEPVILSNEWPRMTSLDLSQNWFKFGSNIPSVDVQLNADDGDQEVANISITFSSQKRGLYKYINGGAPTPYGQTLSDDGVSAGDQVAGDNIWTNLGCYEQMADEPSSFPEEFRLRFNLISDNRITSYLQSMFISDMPLTSTNEEIKSSLKIYPSLATENITVVLSDEFENAQVFVINNSGSLVKSLISSSTVKNMVIDVSDISEGVYTIIVQDEKVTQKGRFVKQ